jgi:hypothetical protein
MSRTVNSLIFGVAALISASAQAQSVDKATSDDRFIYDQVDEGILRLDSRSGEVSLCSRQENAGWACRIVADERRAVDGEIGRLERENSEMRKLLAQSGVIPPGASVGAAPKASTAGPAASGQPETAPAAVPEKAPEKTAEKPAEKPPEKTVEAPAEKKPVTVHLNFGRTIEVVDTIWRRLVEMMANVKADLQKRT